MRANKNEIGSSKNKLSDKASRVQNKLENTYPKAMTGLNFDSPYQLLVATILSAQCTDKKVNSITKKLFSVVSTPEQMVNFGREALKKQIKTAGLYENKSRNIIEASKMLLDQHGGRVPASRKALEDLPGVGRKTASVVLANAFNCYEFPVDTHVFRVSRRIGFSQGETPLQVEKDLKAIFPKEKWNRAHLLLIFHGRNRCKARSPQCSVCEIKEYCEYFNEHFSAPVRKHQGNK